jgi:hypothetical protein
MRLIIKVFFLFIAVQNIHAQCLTTTPGNAPALEATHNHFSSYQQFKGISECLNKTISLNFIIVSDPYYELDPMESFPIAQTIAAIHDNVQLLNTAFSPICLSFQVCDIDTVQEHKYHIWNIAQEEEEFKVLFCKPNVINIILIGSKATLGGVPYASSIGIYNQLLPAKDVIVYPKVFLHAENRNILHQMGHLFGLYHTFENINGLELVNGSNCSTTGDLVCDTPADIFPAPWLLINGIEQCVWDGVTADANADLYAPLFGNIMSLGPCPMGSFTIGQYNRMIYHFKKHRSYLR